MTLMKKKDLEHKFVYHAPDQTKQDVHAFIRHELYKAANSINEICPPCTETMRAIHKIEEAMFLANAAVARNELTDEVKKNFSKKG